ncbi:histidine phosphatase family protein [Pseudonocardia sichuanensis]|uniref:Putative phosphoglycerate mutase n=1 Tax=Pseudonocardia kunmingensis TaxID=630975 RepID=A0A543DZT7_9PSEU|nr:histidine phosphatase family protein [Pseudonocardia kunmingensis]TQM14838.1 putative phosphoglycerate mutase [Pseudonocardia kunmingensis]
MRLLLVRHGETVWNAERRLQGDRDIPLSATGRAQASALAPVVAAHAPACVVTSPLARTRETAELLGFPGERHDARWQEADLGDWTGLRTAVLRERGGAYAAWRAGRFTPPGGEPFAALTERVAAGVADLRADPGGGVVLVVTHGGPIRAVLRHLLGLEPARIVPVGPASLTVLDLGVDGARLHGYNIRAGAEAVQPVGRS